MRNTPTQIIVHHDGVTRIGPSFGVINEYHKQQGFPVSSLGYYVGYHYLIERDGTLRAARQLGEGGAHTKGQNEKSIGICLAGNFDEELPTEKQEATLGFILSMLCHLFSLDEADIYPHRAYANKTCYGRRLSQTWAAGVYLKHEIANYTERLKLLEEE